MTAFHLEVKEKGRVVLPAALRTACAIEVGSDLVARPIGPGCFVVESAGVVLQRIWSGLPEDEAGTEVLRALRDEGDSARWERLETSGAGEDDEASAARAAATLRALGL